MSDSEYAPTWDEMRECYQASNDGLDFKRRFNERGEEADRWLTAHDAEVARAAAEKEWDDFLAYKYLPPAVREYVEAYRLEQNDEQND